MNYILGKIEKLISEAEEKRRRENNNILQILECYYWLVENRMKQDNQLT